MTRAIIIPTPHGTVVLGGTARGRQGTSRTGPGVRGVLAGRPRPPKASVALPAGGGPALRVVRVPNGLIGLRWTFVLKVRRLVLFAAATYRNRSHAAKAARDVAAALGLDPWNDVAAEGRE